MTNQKRKRNTLLIAALLLLILIVSLVLVFRFTFTPNIGLRILQHTFGETVFVTVSGYGKLSGTSISIYLVSGQTSQRIPIYLIRIENMSYQVGFAGGAIAPLPNLNLPQTVEAQTIYDQGNFDFLRTHQDVSTRVVVDGVWIIGQASMGAQEPSAEQCCLQPQ